MSNVQSQSVLAGISTRQAALSDSRYSTDVQKTALSAYERLDAGVTIKTREGDVVTLTSSSYGQLEAFQYNSNGVVQTASGTASVTQNQRQITLSSGDSFSFSVVGELSEQELGDIEAIVAGIDGIISEMAEGDMDEAVDQALSMGGYDTVSMYSADIRYQKSYAMATETRSQTTSAMPVNGTQTEEPTIASGRRQRRTHKKSAVHHMNRFVEKMADQLETHEEKMVARAGQPIEKLFRHHLRNQKANSSQETPVYTTIEDAGKQISKMIARMTAGVFKEEFSSFFE